MAFLQRLSNEHGRSRASNKALRTGAMRLSLVSHRLYNIIGFSGMKSKRPPHVYEVRPRRDHRGFDLISDALPFGRLWYAEPNAISNAVGYAKFYSRSHAVVVTVFDETGAVLETHEHAGDFHEA